MGLRNPRGEVMSEEDLSTSETIPKMCLLAGSTTHPTAAIKTRYFTPQEAHPSLAVSGRSKEEEKGGTGGGTGVVVVV